ncbi:hypothetical protein [Pantoea latae]|jgi:hypothetical protein|uniref:hypothetical protein n=1 Tax=Pantoea latae TaxID=1964541 RepID=UPI00142E39C7|nr:hypothetical protein [Pantoea latae]
MQWLIMVLLALVTGLIASALLIWRRHGWRNKKQIIVMLIVLAAATQIVNVVLVLKR